MSCLSICGGGIGKCGSSDYRKLHNTKSKKITDGILASTKEASSWTNLKRIVRKAMRYYVSRRRISVWVKRKVKLLRYCGKTIGIENRKSAAVRIKRSGNYGFPATYDSVSYALNFDDGLWRDEDVEFSRSGSFAYRFCQSGRMSSVE